LLKSRCFKNTFRETRFELGSQGGEASSKMPHHPDLNAHMMIWATAHERSTNDLRVIGCHAKC
jgi:hypothetical protein